MSGVLKQIGSIPTWASLGFKDGLFYKFEHVKAFILLKAFS